MEISLVRKFRHFCSAASCRPTLPYLVLRCTKASVPGMEGFFLNGDELHRTAGHSAGAREGPGHGLREGPGQPQGLQADLQYLGGALRDV